MQIYQLHHYNKCCSTYWQWALRNKRAHSTHIYAEPHQQHNHKWKHAILKWSEDETGGEQQQQMKEKPKNEEEKMMLCRNASDCSMFGAEKIIIMNSSGYNWQKEKKRESERVQKKSRKLK